MLMYNTALPRPRRLATLRGLIASALSLRLSLCCVLRTDCCERVACVLSALSALWVDSLDSRHSGPVETQTARVSRVERILRSERGPWCVESVVSPWSRGAWRLEHTATEPWAGRAPRVAA